MAKVLLMIAPDKFRDEELFKTKEELEKAGHECTVASSVKTQVTGMLGGKVIPDVAFNEIFSTQNYQPLQYDAYVVIGGQGSLALLNEPQVLAVLKIAQTQNKVVASICWGSRVAAKSGILNGKQATGYPDDETIQTIKDTGATYVDQGVVVDGNLVTSQGPKFAREFGQAIAKLLL